MLTIVDPIGNPSSLITRSRDLFSPSNEMGVDVPVVLASVEGTGRRCEGAVEDGREDCGVVFLEGGGGISVLRTLVAFFLGFGAVTMYLLASMF